MVVLASDDVDIADTYVDIAGVFILQLMLSEWMLEIPDNFVDDWVMVPCPVGKRSLVIASNVCYVICFLGEKTHGL